MSFGSEAHELSAVVVKSKRGSERLDVSKNGASQFARVPFFRFLFHPSNTAPAVAVPWPTPQSFHILRRRRA